MKKSKRQGTNHLLTALNPTINLVVLVSGLVVWAFHTFAQLSYVREQNTALVTMIEQRHREAIDHSDMNRERILALLLEVKESVKSLESKMLVPIGMSGKH